MTTDVTRARALAERLRAARANDGSFLRIGLHDISELSAAVCTLAADLERAREDARRLNGWRFEVVSDGDVRAYAPDGETWLLREGQDGFYGFAHKLCTELAAIAKEEGHAPARAKFGEGKN